MPEHDLKLLKRLSFPKKVISKRVAKHEGIPIAFEINVSAVAHKYFTEFVLSPRWYRKPPTANPDLTSEKRNSNHPHAHE